MQHIEHTGCLLHVLVCTNERKNGTIASCGENKGRAILSQLRRWASRHHLRTRIWLSETSCLGWCDEAGTTLVIYPQGDFYHKVTQQDCAALIETYFEPLLQKEHSQE